MDARIIPNVMQDQSALGLVLADRHGEAGEVSRAIGHARDDSVFDERGWTSLHWASKRGDVELLSRLLDAGADVNVHAKKSEMTPLHVASENGNVEIVARLLAAGADPSSRAKNGATPLHWASKCRKVDVVLPLLSAGADVDACDQDGEAVLHVVSKRRNVEMLSRLLEAGANVDVCDQFGMTALHWASQFGYVDVVSRLVQAQANVNICTEDGVTPLMSSFYSMSYSEEHLCTKRILLMHGATWNDDWVSETCDRKLFCKHRAAIREWIAQREKGLALTDLPFEVLDRGEADIKEYFTAVNEDMLDRVYRQKLCVVGPSGWGKTSLIKTFLERAPQPDGASETTIGIDTFTWEFQCKDGFVHSVSLWDFAGQDEYHPAHALFYSRRTIYLLVVDLSEYNKALQMLQGLQMTRFYERHIYRWIRSICGHTPDSEFVFVGTKADKVNHDVEVIQRIQKDLIERFHHCEAIRQKTLRNTIRDIQKLISGQPDSKPTLLQKHTLDDLMKKAEKNAKLRSVFLSLCSRDMKGWAEMDAQLQDLIIDGNTRFRMPLLYSQVSEFLAKLKLEAPARVYLRIPNVFVSFESLLSQLHERKIAVNAESLRAVLHTLHDLGDLLWFDGSVHHEALAECIFLDTELVIDLIRQVVNHRHGKEACEGKNHVGLLRHEELVKRDPWCYIENKLMHGLKELLHHLRLVYPTHGEMDVYSDLVVPALWGPSCPNTSKYHLQHCLQHEVMWDYVFQSYVPDDLFNKFAVAAHGLIAMGLTSERACGQTFFDVIGSRHAALVSRLEQIDGACFSVTIRIQVRSCILGHAWNALVAICSVLENLLKNYPGVHVTRYTISKDGQTEHRYQVDRLLTQLQNDMHKDFAPSIINVFLPPNMSWYTGEPNPMQQRKLALRRGLTHHFDELGMKIKSLEKMCLLHNRRLYPPNWTVTYKKAALPLFKDEFVLRIHSCISLKCYHHPIVVQARASLLRRIPEPIKKGVSVLVGITFESLLEGAGTREAFDKSIDDASRFQAILDTISRETQSAALTLKNTHQVGQQMMDSLLMRLMELHDSRFTPVHFVELSGLKCVWHEVRRQFIWAHDLELEAHPEKSSLIVLNDVPG